jgi:hypothetical protein
VEQSTLGEPEKDDVQPYASYPTLQIDLRETGFDQGTKQMRVRGNQSEGKPLDESVDGSWERRYASERSESHEQWAHSHG